MQKLVAINEKNRPIGEGHHRATLTDDQVDRIRDLNEDHDVSYRQLAAMYQVPRSTIASICQYRTRAQTPFGWKELKAD